MMKLFTQYTHLNLFFVIIAIILGNTFMSTIAFINSCAICSSFHSVLIFDVDAFDKIRYPYTKNG